MSALHCDSQFVLQRGGGGLATAGQGPDHQQLAGLQLGQQIPAGMTKLTGHAVSLDGIADRFTYDETDFRRIHGV
ncbi:hypothetical protein A5630_29520 [Mycolicibacterium mucogenicum]|uniref:Uncharacterized protein n=1 Tax=Mycolicibacterium mucogenicum TaxID=56689 RepID=A0A1A3GT22_MYCMU|nr:hypothetical protein A5630_29520 [Mycolicibacterium mucogenicum]